jgi:hypothetical protein
MVVRRSIWVTCLLALTGCGPSVSEVRMANYPPREPNCALEFVKIDMGQLSGNTGPWELIGQIVLQEEGTQDPFAERNRAIVRPRACNMGGEAVGVAMSAVSQGAISSGSAISYGVLRKRTSESNAPQKF